MTIFEYVTAALLIILGLGITELLNDAVGLFRDRRERQMHWIPLAWAAIIFAHQMQFLWAIFEINSLVQSWSALNFIHALLLVLLLFVAGALIIPRPSDSVPWDPWERFIENGRWSLIALSVYCLLAFIANPVFFAIDYFASENIPNLVLSACFLGTFFMPGVRSWGIATVVLAIFSAYEIVLLSPSTYP